MGTSDLEILDRELSSSLNTAFLGRSIHFARCGTPIPVSVAAHVSLMTGHPPEETGVFDSHGKLESDVSTLAGHFKEGGFDTFGCVSRSSLGRRSGLDSGFSSFDDKMEFLPIPLGSERFRDGLAVGKAADHQLRGIVDRRFFGWVHFSDLISPGRPGKPTRTREEKIIDIAAGSMRLLDTIRQAGHLDSTIIVVTSVFGARPDPGADSLLLKPRAVEVPCVVWSSALAGSSGRVVESPVSLLDLGSSLAGLLMKKSSVERDFFATGLSPDTEELQVVSRSFRSWSRYGLHPLVSVTQGDLRLLGGARWALFRKKASGEERIGRGSWEEEGGEGAALKKTAQDCLLKLLAYVGDSSSFPLLRKDPRDFASSLIGLEEAWRQFSFGKNRRSLDLCNRVLGSVPQMVPAAGLVRGSSFLSLGKLDEAGGDLKNATAWFSGLSSAPFREFEILLELARENFPRALKVSLMAVQEFPRSARLAGIRGRLLRVAGELDESRRYLSEASGDFPGAWEVWYELGLLLRDGGETDESISAFRRSIQAGAAVREPRAPLARIFQSGGRFEEAAEQFVAAIGLGDPDPELFFQLGQCYEAIGVGDLAMKAYETTRKLDNNVDAATWRIAFLKDTFGDREGAVQELEALVSRNPIFDFGHELLVSFYREDGKSARALSVLNAVEDGQDKVWVSLQKGQVLSRLNREREAVVVLRGAVVKVPDHPGLLNELSWILISAGDESVRNPTEALQHAREAIQFAPENLDFRDTWVRSLLAAGKKEEGVRATLDLAQVLDRSGRQKEASSLIKEALKHFPDAVELKKRLDVY